jgi:hypothetical protein
MCLNELVISNILVGVEADMAPPFSNAESASKKEAPTEPDEGTQYL